MKTNKTPILPLIPTNVDAELQRYMQSVNSFLQEISQNVRADIDEVNNSIPVVPTYSNNLSIKATTAAYTILDGDGFDLVMVDSRAGSLTITLPTLADNQGRVITVMAAYLGGTITVDGEGAETIDGIETAVLQSKDDFVTVVGTATEWKILSTRQVMSTGWINTNDWTVRHLGNINLTYDTKTGSFILGEVVREYSDAGYTTATGKYGIIMTDSGTALVLKDTAIGTFTDNYYLKGDTSGAVALVNVNTKNVDTNIYHGMGRNINSLTVTGWISTDGSDANAVIMPSAFHYMHSGAHVVGIDQNSAFIQTGYGGMKILNTTSGTEIIYDTEDHYYKIQIVLQK